MDGKVLVEFLINTKVCKVDEMQGCTSEEIDRLEKLAGIRLPKAYREFLLAIGRRAGKLFQGTDILFPALDGVRDAAIHLLHENGETFRLPSDAFVFSMHQGYEFDYFIASQGDDPPVYQYVEGSGSPALIWPSFSEFLRESIALHAQAASGEGRSSDF